MTDIVKAFLHIQLAEEDRNYTHFVWLSQPNDAEHEFVIYCFKVALFGSVSSPFMLSATLHKLLLTDGFPLAKDIQQNIYVDNIMSGFPSVDVATQYYHKKKANDIRCPL